MFVLAKVVIFNVEKKSTGGIDPALSEGLKNYLPTLAVQAAAPKIGPAARS